LTEVFWSKVTNDGTKTVGNWTETLECVRKVEWSVFDLTYLREFLPSIRSAKTIKIARSVMAIDHDHRFMYRERRVVCLRKFVDLYIDECFELQSTNKVVKQVVLPAAKNRIQVLAWEDARKKK